MIIFKKAMSVILILMITFGVVSLTTSCDSKEYTIGICQLGEHGALNEATAGFKDAVIAELGEDAVAFDYQNAANDIASCSTIVNSFVSKNVDLILANSTPVLQAAAAATTDIPILGTAITEYGAALNIDNYDGLVGGNISGTSDIASLEEVAQIAIDEFPNAKKVGLLYCSGEANSAYQIQVVSDYLEGKGLECKRYSFVDSNDVFAVAAKAMSDCDLIYIPTDNTAANCTSIINDASLSSGVPVFGGDGGICAGCGTYTLTVSYYNIGYQTGLMAAKILKGEADISTMAVEYDPTPVKVYNPINCNILGLSVPDGYVALDDIE